MGTNYKFEAATVWIDGTTLAGQINEIELPELTWESSEHETIALLGTPEFASKLEPMEATLTWAGYSPDLAAAAANPYRTVNLQVRANFGEYRAGDKASDELVRIDLTGRFLSNPLGTYGSSEFERESMMKVDFVSERRGGEEVLAVGVNPPIYRVRGEDLLAGMRRNLGL